MGNSVQMDQTIIQLQRTRTEQLSQSPLSYQPLAALRTQTVCNTHFAEVKEIFVIVNLTSPIFTFNCSKLNRHLGTTYHITVNHNFCKTSIHTRLCYLLQQHHTSYSKVRDIQQKGFILLEFSPTPCQNYPQCR
jgi:hypothetical protein